MLCRSAGKRHRTLTATGHIFSSKRGRSPAISMTAMRLVSALMSCLQCHQRQLRLLFLLLMRRKRRHRQRLTNRQVCCSLFSGNCISDRLLSVTYVHVTDFARPFSSLVAQLQHLLPTTEWGGAGISVVVYS